MDGEQGPLPTSTLNSEFTTQTPECCITLLTATVSKASDGNKTQFKRRGQGHNLGGSSWEKFI